MAIVEDEVRNGSEEENEMEVVPEDDDAEQDSDDSDDEDEEDGEEALERKLAYLEQQIADDPYNYDDHIELIHALWSLTDLDRWRSAFDRLQTLSILKPEHWLLRIQTEESLAHSEESRDKIYNLFSDATLDCYSIPILTEWCTWLMGSGDTEKIRFQLDEVLKRAGADPLSGKIFWDAKIEMEKAKLESMSVEDSEYNLQRDRVVWCCEEAASRPLLRGEDACALLDELQTTCSEKIKRQHAAAMEYLQKITPYEDKLLTIDDAEEKCKVYQEYIDSVKVLAEEEKYAECDSNGILKVLYDRATSECLSCEAVHDMLLEFIRHVQKVSSRDTVRRILDMCTRRCSTKATFWVLKMQQAEHEEKSFEEIKSIFEVALSKGMETYKHAEALWLSYLEYSRRRTNFDNEANVDRLRRTFRLAWDSLAEAWGEEANDSEVPLYWARLEYKLMKDPKQGKEIFEEIFKYGENKTLSKYWETLITLEIASGAGSGKRFRDLLARALRCVADYPPALARLWTDHERDHGDLRSLRDCQLHCEIKIKEWRENYQAMKEKMMGNKKGKQSSSQKGKSKKTKDAPNTGKRKSDDKTESSGVKRKKDDMEVDAQDSARAGRKRTHDTEEADSSSSKRLRDDSETASGSREDCTLFVSNLEFKVNEDNLRKKLSVYGSIVSLRVRAGVKAFGGSICYCQYTSPSAVEKAVKDDRTPLDGRPMFLSRYTAKKGNPMFKYATEREKNKLFVKNLSFTHCTKEALAEVFDKYGKLRDVRVVTFKDGKPKGLAYIEYEDEKSAAEALEKTNGMTIGDRVIDVAISAPPVRSSSEPPSLGQPKREVREGMRRTQLSSLIPSVLIKPSTSQAASGSNDNPDKKTLSNSDFRSLLLKK